ncbi:ATPase, T2SS/T4P/T4SS family [Psychrobacillus sp. FSL K6-1464]|uniref:ATPase, T2SS/T4P/T4SS family n=1 Tax=Psychrobacillus sp. FSL K6-1464 TaxID=2921545 RepID=UPI0030F877A7
MEQNLNNIRKSLAGMRSGKNTGKRVLDEEEAIEIVRTHLGERLKELSEQGIGNEKKEKDKPFFRKQFDRYKNLVSDIVFKEDLRIRGYEQNEIHKFIHKCTHEIKGYSVLAEAFEDPGVSDIYCIKWDTIFVERNGENARYEHIFKNEKHYNETLFRFLQEAGKEINNGDKKIVDFELYGDRGCATSPRVSPSGYSLTLRKHSEDHIKRDDLINYKVVSEEIADLLGLVVVGESNLIYAGITGSGKTTTIRAILDYYVTRANKRMLLCEDTQELFPENEHTLQLVSVKSSDPEQAVPLDQLIITALRLKPKYIVVGEVRGLEAQAAVEGMETGHSTIFTMHGGNPWNIVNRLVTKYLMAMPALGIDVVERIIGSSLDYICIQDNIPGVGRKMTMMHEVSYNFSTRRMELKMICHYDFALKDFVMDNKISMEKANTMMRRGVQWEDVEKWVEKVAAA